MNPALQELLDVLQVRPLGADVFAARSQDLGYKRVFGGQVLGQALMAAQQTVPEGVRAHSLHAYFLRVGDDHRDIEYRVERTRDGRSFSTRNVIAKQQNEAIFSMSVSFQTIETGFEHQRPMPATPAPASLPHYLDATRKSAKDMPDLTRRLTHRGPFEIRCEDPVDYLHPRKRPPNNQLWVRVTDKIPNDPLLHQCLLAYASDFGLIEVAMFPHGVTFLQKNMQVASLDHALWFHHDIRIDEWILYDVHSPCAGASRGLSFGSFFDHSGKLVASSAQEGLLRRREP